jgi:hypothetical protein
MFVKWYHCSKRNFEVIIEPLAEKEFFAKPHGYASFWKQEAGTRSAPQQIEKQDPKPDPHQSKKFWSCGAQNGAMEGRLQ